MIKVTIGGEDYQYEKGTRYEKIAGDFQDRYKYRICLVLINGKLQELFHILKADCRMDFITIAEQVGHDTYVRTAIMMFLKSLMDQVGAENIERTKIEFVIGGGYFCSVKGDVKVDEALVKSINERMLRLSRENRPIEKKKYPIEEAMDIFREKGYYDKEKLFRYRRSSTINMYTLEGFTDYYYGYMMPSTGYVKYFDVISYDNGFMLLLPGRDYPDKIAFFEPREKLFATLMQSTEWGRCLDIENVGDLNDRICQGRSSELILVQESLQESRIGEIASDIRSREGVRFVMIAGPSSSGKTTFSHRLSMQLRARGLKPHPIALDDYFKNREDTPRDEKGNFDFECLEAIDVEGFNRDMKALLNGETVELPCFNFKTGLREYRGNTLTLGPEDILVIEGIHGLNDRMSYELPQESKYKVYISALTSLNVDDHNRISTTDGRLIRRMVRDARTRGTDASRTLAMWESVNRGERRYIFPFQEKVDATFNSVLIYELAVLKQYAEPLLFSIKKDDPGYYEARRLLKFLEYFMGIPTEDIPTNSIVREFIGGSIFQV